MKVKAKRLGYFGNKRVREGEIFEINSEELFSTAWMEKVSESEPVKVSKPKKSEEKSKDLDVI